MPLQYIYRQYGLEFKGQPRMALEQFDDLSISMFLVVEQKLFKAISQFGERMGRSINIPIGKDESHFYFIKGKKNEPMFLTKLRITHKHNDLPKAEMWIHHHQIFKSRTT